MLNEGELIMAKFKKNMLILLFLTLTLFIIAPYANASPESYQNTKETAREAVWKAITSGQCSSATVAVMDKGKVVYSEQFGAAERKTDKSVDKYTRFNIGSTSKMFVAVSVLLLVDEGKVSLDDPVVKYISDFVMKDPRYRNITVRMLFNHSSGLSGSSFLFGYEPEGDPHKILLERLKDENLKHDPGAFSIYCNDGFTLAEMIVERLSGRKFIDFLVERVFLPLGMKDTKESIGEVGGNISHFYDPETGKKYPAEVILVHAAGGLSSTAEDLCRFADSFCSGGKNILSSKSIEEILKRQPTPFFSKMRGVAILDSFGWDYSSLPPYAENGIRVFSKGGGTGAYSTGLQVLPDKRIAVAASMSGRLNGEAVTRPVLDALMKDKGLPLPSLKEKGKPKDPETIPLELSAYEGIYANGSSFVRITFNKDKKSMDIFRLMPDKPKGSGGADVPVMSYVYNGGSFFSFEKDLQGYFIKDADRRYFFKENDPLYPMDFLQFQSVEKIDKPQKLFSDINGKLWLMRNLTPANQLYKENAMVISYTYEDLPGYLSFGNTLRIVSRDHATYAAPMFRDQSEFYLYEIDGMMWVRSGIFLFSEAEKAKKIDWGKNSVMIGEKGYVEWYKVEEDHILSFEKPEKGRILVVEEEETDKIALYDSLVDDGKVYAPKGSYVVCIGQPGDLFTISAK